MKKALFIFALLFIGAGCTDKGTITGNVGYPSDGPFPFMRICAEDTTSKATTCTEKVKEIKEQNQTKHTYTLRVPPGKYNVYAQVPKNEAFKDYKAYYSKFVTCGIKNGCNDHTPIVVEVKTGETKDKIDPMDWYK